MTNFSRMCLFWFLLLLAACGGGGGDGEDDTHTVSGTIKPASGSFVDSDVNDPNAPIVANGSFSTAQIIYPPATIGGYASASGAGEPGSNFETLPDNKDIYKARLNTGDTLYLTFSGSSVNDLDLYLYNDSETLVAQSAQPDSELEQVAVPSDGTFYIEVRAVSGAAVYNISFSTTTAAGRTVTVEDDFVPGEILVRFRDQDLPASRSAMAQAVEPLGLDVRQGAPGRAMLLALPEAATHGVLSSGERRTLKVKTLEKIEELRRRPDVLYAEPNAIHHPLFVPNDPFYDFQWHYDQINLRQAWDLNTGSGVIVAVIDTGVLRNHPDLSGGLTSTGYDFIRATEISADGDGIDSNPEDPGDGGAFGSSFHGTHVAGTVAARTNNGIGVAGVAFNAKIMALRALGVGGGTTYDIAQCVRYAAGLTNDSDIALGAADRADIINMSIGSPVYEQTLQDAIAAARTRNVIVVAAAGNSGNSSAVYPAAYSGVIAVSAVDYDRERAPYSNSGTYIDMAAPGGSFASDANRDGFSDGVLSTLGDDSSGTVQYTYDFYEGTSMAAPHVAGIFALMRAAESTLQPSQVDQAVAAGELTVDLGAAGFDIIYGHGLVDAHKAVLWALGNPPGSTIITAWPDVVSMASDVSQEMVTISASGNDAVTVTGASVDNAWLGIASVSVDGDGLGTYRITVNRSHPDLQDGQNRGNATFTSTENTVVVPVLVEKLPAGVSHDAGYHYVLLLDADTMELRYQAEASVSGGVYTYSISGVESGRYMIIAGSDLDNDFYLWDSGEAKGAWPTVDLATEVEVSGDRSGLDFTTGFSPTFFTQFGNTGGNLPARSGISGPWARR